MILRINSGSIILLIVLVRSVAGQDDDSLANTFLSGKTYLQSIIENIIWEKETRNIVFYLNL